MENAIVKKLRYYFDYDNFLKGSIGKEIVKAMLEKSGYTVCPYGYEITLLDAKSKLTPKTRNSNTGLRIRSSPDLLVYDDQNLMLVEVKSRSSSPPQIKFSEIQYLKEFWSDSILVIIVPEDNVFYAQRTNEIEIQQGDYYPLSIFKPFQAIFTKVKAEDISHYSHFALQNLTAKKDFIGERKSELSKEEDSEQLSATIRH
jgi:hypothetical protein